MYVCAVSVCVLCQTLVWYRFWTDDWLKKKVTQLLRKEAHCTRSKTPQLRGVWRGPMWRVFIWAFGPVKGSLLLEAAHYRRSNHTQMCLAWASIMCVFALETTLMSSWKPHIIDAQTTRSCVWLEGGQGASSFWKQTIMSAEPEEKKKKTLLLIRHGHSIAQEAGKDCKCTCTRLDM